MRRYIGKTSQINFFSMQFVHFYKQRERRL